MDKAIEALHKERTKLLLALRKEVESWTGPQREKAKRLNISQPRLNLLLRSPDTTRFSLNDLVRLLTRAGVEISIQREAA